LKRFRFLLVLSLILSLMLSAMPALGAGLSNDNGPAFIPGKILVKFKAGTDEVTKQNIHRANRAAVVQEIKQLDVQVLQVPETRVNELVLAYVNNPAVEYAEPDYIATALEFTPDDPKFGEQWGMTTIEAPAAWGVETGNPNIEIAILDTGIDQNHEDLAAKISYNKNFTDSLTYDDLYGHGTHVAGIAAAVTNNGIGVAGIGYQSSLMNIKVLDDTGGGAYSWIASGIIEATKSGAKVINMSLGGKFGSTTLQNAVNYAWENGVVIVAAAGNSGTSRPNYPAYYSNCIAVAATDSNDAKASFSNYGSWVDAAAPGVGIYSTLPNHSNGIGIQDYGFLSGTSMSTPYVAGLAGLVWATDYGDRNLDVRNRIESTADLAGSMWTSYDIKRINANNAVVAVDTPDIAPPVITALSAVPSSTTAVIRWTTDEAADSLVEYGVDSFNLGNSVPDTNLVTDHSLTLTGLSSATSYFYKVTSKDAAGNQASDSGSFATTEAVQPTIQVLVPATVKLSNTWVNITVLVKDPSENPLPGVIVDAVVTAPDKTTQYTGTTDAAGQVIFKYRILKSSKVGEYTVTASTGTVSSETRFTVYE